MILSFGQVGLSLHPIPVFKYLDLPQPLPTSPTDNMTIFLPILTGLVKSQHPYNILLIFSSKLNSFKFILPKNSELTV